MKARMLREEQGFTLVEAMVALFVLMVGVMSLFTMQLTAINSNTTATGITWGTAWVTDQIEYLIKLPYDDNLLKDTTANPAPAPVASPDGHYSVSWTVNEDSPMENLKALTITVQYTDRATQKSMVMDYVKSSM
ncbi:type IV pilus modification PilV family protein [Desulfogranum japonicum]|uniref:type IV pilus modification PilV family protein n=1 Tax=Desulfogranum japonicum TaxID=231447 RepID=UPI00040CDE9D|nr:prepilin-type N-terminal cleavage/methylation domain-containing protein [Desulfogranum japonicum]